MFQAQLLKTGVSGGIAAPVSVYSPWFARLADNVGITLELVAFDGSPSLKLEVVDRTAEGTGSGGAPLSGSITLTTATRSTAEWTGLKEFVRFKVTLSEASGIGTCWAVFRVLDAVWHSDVKV